ncbi:cytochrome P450 [Dendrothele bispora CBS 962.96]|uniref:Cytochrome P450 n=1 Tax=Dendrothele bispora (strain CBS 962.96) TaxID=1314807 RepID=A0A4S8M1G9_DENBC|nr:cytochrome P450 [Dendrothele bispora CBS 962.96]
MTLILPLQILATAIVCLLALRYLLKNRPNAPYPPGPRGIPILGNLFQLNPKASWRTFAEWGKLYGPITYINVAGQPIVILNTKKVAFDLLEYRASISSERPRLIVASEATGNLNIGLIHYGERWRRMRHASDYALGAKISSNYHHVQTKESIILAHGILNRPDTWKAQLERMSSSSTLAMVYDLPPIQSLDDPTIVFMNSFIECIAKVGVPGAFLVDMLPFLERLPRFVSKWKQDAEKDFKKFTFKFEQMFLGIKRKTVKGHEQGASFCANLSENQTQNKLSDRECAWLAGTLYGAGQETTATAMMWFIFCMILFPDVQTRAQDELDKVVGRSRLPSFSDAKQLPYIQALVKEVLRWKPSTPSGLPHQLTKDDYYDGYFMPSRTIYIANLWAINRDAEVYGADANDFRPERHLDDNGNLKDDRSEVHGHFSYGFGHRICVGRHVANNTLYISMATILWAMFLEPQKDVKGNPIKPEVDGEEWNGIVMRPPLFKFDAKPRFVDADSLIQQARDQIMEEVLACPDAE